MKRLVAAGWLRRRPDINAEFARLERIPGVLVAGRDARTRDRGLSFDDRMTFAQISKHLESEGQR